MEELSVSSLFSTLPSAGVVVFAVTLTLNEPPVRRRCTLTTRRGGHLELLTHLSVLLAEKPTCSCVKLRNVEHVVVNLSLQTPCPLKCASSRPHPPYPHTQIAAIHEWISLGFGTCFELLCKQHSPLSLGLVWCGSPAQFCC